MSNSETVTFEQGIKMLEEEVKLNKDAPLSNPTELPLNKIRIAHSVFQPRQFLDETRGASEEHIKILEDAILQEPNHRLDAIVVWWSGKHYRVLDGMHRTHAYTRVNNKKSLKINLVPVKVFIGNLYQAIAESARLNAKDKLPMSKSDKLNRAWKLTILDKYTKRDISSICKVGTTTVARMRSMYATYERDYPDDFYVTALSTSWEEAQLHGLRTVSRDDSWEHKLALEWSKRLAKAFGIKLATQPKISALAIELYSDRLADELVTEWVNRKEILAGQGAFEHDF